MSPAMNYHEATGVRARSDLSANARPGDDDRMTDEQLLTFAEWMSQQVKIAEQRGSTHVFVPVRIASRVAVAALELVNRGSTP